MAVASAHGGRVLFGAALAALVSSAIPILLLNDLVDDRLRLEGRGLLVLLYGLGAVFWTAFCVSIAVNGQWSWMRKRPGAFILAALIVSLVYPLQRSLVDVLFRGKVELIATSVLGSASICVGAALLSRRWLWRPAIAMLGWAVVCVLLPFGAWIPYSRIPTLRGVGADWLPFFISWQVPHAVLAAAWLVLAKRASQAHGERSP